MRIGELGERAGVTPRALRHYEELGLLPARRLANGYREYGEHDLALVAEIHRLVELGFALEETRPFVECLRAGYPSGAAARPRRRCSGASSPRWTGGSRRLQQVRNEIGTELAAPPPACELSTEEIS